MALSTNQIPMHSHTPTVYGDPVEGDLSDPTGKTWAKTGSGEFDFGGNTDANMAAGAMTVNNAGSDQAHNNIPPYLGIHYIIALVGIYPSR